MKSGRNRIYLSNLWKWTCGMKEDPLPEEKTRRVPPLKELAKMQWCDKFEGLMRRRLIMGSFRYGLLEKGSGKDFNSIGSAMERLRLYQDTGNAEHLVDAANLCLVEFTAESHDNFHFSATDDGIHTEKIER